MWKRLFHSQSIPIVSYRSISSLSNDLLRQRLKPHIHKGDYVDELTQTLPNLKSFRKSAILLPLYCNTSTNRVDVLVAKRSDKVRSHTGMIAFPGGMIDSTDRDTIHTAEREAEEELGLKPEHYSTLGYLPPVIDSRAVLITPVVALLHSPKFTEFCLSTDEIAEAFYIDLEQFLYAKNNYKMLEVGNSFVTHHFDIEKYHIWGVTAFELIVLATLVFQQLPEFTFFRHGIQLDLRTLSDQLKTHFHLCINYRQMAELKAELDEIGRSR